MNKKQIQSRRERVIALYSSGLNQESISKDMKISQSTVHRDLLFERNRINGQTQSYLQAQLPFEQQACITGINRVIRMAWEIAWDSFRREPNIQKTMWRGELRNLRGEVHPYYDKDSGHRVALQAMKLASTIQRFCINLFIVGVNLNRVSIFNNINIIIVFKFFRWPCN